MINNILLLVLHGVKATILDALKKHPGHRLDGATLYCTLIPDHNDSQMIREVGISTVVYRDDKFPNYAFTKAAKKILQGLEVRYMYVHVVSTCTHTHLRVYNDVV